MIFVTVGSQKFQFNRLLMKVDELVKKHLIEDKVFAQIGVCTYKPQYYEYVDFIDADHFSKLEDKMDIMITHGGTGAIVSAVKRRKKVIAVPRLKKYGEHIDDHQIQILREFERMRIIKACYELNDLEKIYKEIQEADMIPYHSNTMNIIRSIESFLAEER